MNRSKEYCCPSTSCHAQDINGKPTKGIIERVAYFTAGLIDDGGLIIDEVGRAGGVEEGVV